MNMSAIQDGVARDVKFNVHSREPTIAQPLKTMHKETKNKITSMTLMDLTKCSIDNVDKLVTLMEMIIKAIEHCKACPEALDDETTSVVCENLAFLYSNLKKFGPKLDDAIFRSQLDRACTVFRSAIVDLPLASSIKIHLIKLIELGMGGNMLNNNFEFDNKTKFGSHISPEEYLKRTLHIPEVPPKKTTNKCFKNDIVIRNSDSGKVMGIKGRRVHMIEQLSDTIISFQRVPSSAKERVVQISGAGEENINYAERLIQHTIRNNASPVLGMSTNESLTNSDEMPLSNQPVDGLLAKSYVELETSPYMYRHKVTVCNSQLLIFGDDYNYVTLAKATLDKYFQKLRKGGSTESEHCIEDTRDSQQSPEFPPTCPTPMEKTIFPIDMPPPLPPTTVTNLESMYSLKMPLMSPVVPVTEMYSVPMPVLAVTPRPVHTDSDYQQKISAVKSVKDMDKNLSDAVYNAIHANANNKNVLSESLIFSNNSECNQTTRKANVVKPADVPVALPTRARGVEHETKSKLPRITFTKEFMLQLRDHELSKQVPENWEEIVQRFPLIVAHNIEQPVDYIDLTV